MSPEELAILKQTEAEYRLDQLNELQVREPVKFTSYSKGRRRSGPQAGEKRFRKYPEVVEIAWYNGKTIGTRKVGDRLDERAAEIFNDKVDGMDQQDTLRERLKNLQRRLS